MENRNNDFLNGAILSPLLRFAGPVLLALFAGSQAESFVRYFVIVIFAGIVWPLTFPFFANIGKKGKAA